VFGVVFEELDHFKRVLVIIDGTHAKHQGKGSVRTHCQTLMQSTQTSKVGRITTGQDLQALPPSMFLLMKFARRRPVRIARTA
jgi:hypothetical protein